MFGGVSLPNRSTGDAGRETNHKDKIRPPSQREPIIETYKMIKDQVNNALKQAIRKSPLAPALRKLFKRTPFTNAIEVGLATNWENAARWLISSAGRPTLVQPQFHALLRHKINVDIHTEFLLTALRMELLLSNHKEFERQEIQETICSLTCQCINNEYVWYVSDKEQKKLTQLDALVNDTEPAKKLSWQTAALLAMYHRPSRFLKDGISKEEVVNKFTSLPQCLRTLINEYLADFKEETSIKATIESFGGIENATSKMIAQNYEEYPYPRWIHMETPRQRRVLLRNFFEEHELAFLDKPLEVLVAGCGTGSKAIEYAMDYGNHAQVLAVDLSRASLAYAARMARKLKVNNIRFLQMDLLDVPKLNQQFDIVECTGVLHHMQDPIEGGKALVDRLRDGGIMHISFYSELARRSIVKFRQECKLEPTMNNNQIRAYRRQLMLDNAEIIDQGLSLRWDFFDLDRCKDLLFHPLEHRFTIPRIGEFLLALGLEFRGFEKPPLIPTQYWTPYPPRAERRNLAPWHAFEINNPDAFGNLYEIWAKKIP